MSRPISAAFGKGSGRARGTLKTQTGGLENPDGRSGRAQAELGSAECTRRRRSSDIDALLTVPITASCWVGVVDQAGATRCGRRRRIVFGAYGIVALAAPKGLVLRKRPRRPRPSR